MADPAREEAKVKTRVLHCREGDHDWKAPVTRGPGPRNCPDHPAPAVVKKPPEPKQVSYVKVISDALETPRAKSCDCDLHPGMTFDEISALGGGCTMPRFCCPVLDSINRKIGFRPEEARAGIEPA